MAEWETSKENVQPTRRGRAVSTLNAVLGERCEGNHAAKLEQERRELVKIIQEYEGEDPLLPWLNLIKWVKTNFPSEGPQSDLVNVLETCTRTFLKDKEYHTDVRYLRVWIQYADCCVEPQDIFAFLEANDIGQEHALFYEAYATYLELRRHFAKAKDIYALGIARDATPKERLVVMSRAFEERMAQRIQRRLLEEQEKASLGIADGDAPGPVRRLGPRATPSPAVSAGGRPQSFARPAARNPKPVGNSQSGGFTVFVDSDLAAPAGSGAGASGSGAGVGTSEQQRVKWETLQTEKERAKENTQQATRWTNARIPAKKPALTQAAAPPALEVFQDEDLMGSDAALAPSRREPAQATPTGVRRQLEAIQDPRQGREVLRADPLHRINEASPGLERLGTPHASAPGPSHLASKALHSTPLSPDAAAHSAPPPSLPDMSYEERRLDLWCRKRGVSFTAPPSPTQPLPTQTIITDAPGSPGLPPPPSHPSTSALLRVQDSGLPHPSGASTSAAGDPMNTDDARGRGSSHPGVTSPLVPCSTRAPPDLLPSSGLGPLPITPSRAAEAARAGPSAHANPSPLPSSRVRRTLLGASPSTRRGRPPSPSANQRRGGGGEGGAWGGGTPTPASPGSSQRFTQDLGAQGRGRWAASGQTTPIPIPPGSAQRLGADLGEQGRGPWGTGGAGRGGLGGASPGPFEMTLDLRRIGERVLPSPSSGRPSPAGGGRGSATGGWWTRPSTRGRRTMIS